VTVSKIGREQAHGGEMESPVRQCRQERRELPARPRRLGPLVGGVLREAQPPDAIREHRRESLAYEQPAGIHFRHMGEENRRGDAIPTRHKGQVSEQRIIP